MKEFVIIGYSYNELNDEAKEKVKQWYLNHDWRNEAFQENTEAKLLEQFQNSHLQVKYSLNYCQGDGLNIYGTLNLYDFLDKWDATEMVKEQVKYYFDNSKTEYVFTGHHRYCYSHKFIDKKEIVYIVDEIIEKLQQLEIVYDKTIIQTFFNDRFNYFEELDKKFEQDGYKYLYECDEWEVADFCEANDYYFNKNGELIG